MNVKKVKEDLIKWIQETVGNCTVVIGISGGVDSSVTAAICVEALGKDKVFGVLMPDGEQHDIDMSYKVCNHLGIPYIVVNIGGATNALRKAIYQHTDNVNFPSDFVYDYEDNGRYNDMYETNTPARVRMTVLYGIAALLGNARVANTCNLSEDWVGYSTKFGDNAGDFSPLANLTKTEVRLLGKELLLPKDANDKEAIDGMSKKLLADGTIHYITDEEKLGFTYAELDKYIRTNLIDNLEHKEKIDRMHKMNLHKVNPMPKFEYEGSPFDYGVKMIFAASDPIKVDDTISEGFLRRIKWSEEQLKKGDSNE